MSQRATYSAGGEPPLRWRNTVRQVREAAGLRQVDLAVAAQMQRTNVAAIETHMREPTVGSLLRIARALGCGLDDLVAVEGER